MHVIVVPRASENSAAEMLWRNTSIFSLNVQNYKDRRILEAIYLLMISLAVVSIYLNICKEIAYQSYVNSNYIECRNEKKIVLSNSVAQLRLAKAVGQKSKTSRVCMILNEDNFAIPIFY